MKLRMARCHGGTSTTIQAGLSRLLPVRSDGDKLLRRLFGAPGVVPGTGWPHGPATGGAFSSIGVVAGLLPAIGPWWSACRPRAPADLPRCMRPEPPDDGHGSSGSVRYRDDSYVTRGMERDRGRRYGLLARNSAAAVAGSENPGPLVGWSGESKSGRFWSCFWNARISCSGVSRWSLWDTFAMLACDLDLRLLLCLRLENRKDARGLWCWWRLIIGRFTIPDGEPGTGVLRPSLLGALWRLSRDGAPRRRCEMANRVACTAGSSPSPETLLTLSRGTKDVERSICWCEGRCSERALPMAGRSSFKPLESMPEQSTVKFTCGHKESGYHRF
jgi:hypothetical protein